MVIVVRVAALMATIALGVVVWEAATRRDGAGGAGTMVNGAGPLEPALRPPYDFRTAGLGSERTVVVALTADCQACVESVEFYRTLMDAADLDGRKRRFLVLAKYYGKGASDMLKSNGFRPHKLLSFPFSRYLDAPNLPTLFVVDGEGEVIGRWVGKLTVKQQDEVLAAVRVGRRPLDRKVDGR